MGWQDGTPVEQKPRWQTGTPVASPASAKPERGFLGDLGAYARGVAEGVSDFDPAAIVANLGTRATDAIGLTEGANAKIRSVMGRQVQPERNLTSLIVPQKAQSAPDKYASGGRVVGQMMGGAAAFPAATVPGIIGAGAATSAITSDANTTGGFLADTATGTGVTLGTLGAAKVIGRLAAPATARVRANPAMAAKYPYAADVAKLQDAGVPLTPGMALGGVARRAEEAISGVPFLGSLIRKGQSDAVTGLNRAAANRALAPLGDKVPMSAKGSDLFAYTQDAFDRAYDKARAGLQFEPDADFSQGVGQILSDAETSATMSADHIRRLKAQVSILQDRVTRAGGKLAGDDLKGITSDLNKTARKLQAGNNSADDQTLGEYLEALARQMDAAATRNPASDATAVALMRKADAGYGDLVILQNAARMRGGEQSVATVKQMDAAVQKADSSARNNKYLANKARMQDLTGPAGRVLPENLPNSGTPERAAWLAMMGGAYPFSPLATGAAAAASVPYLPGANRVVENLLTRRPGLMLQAGKGAGQLATPLSRAVAIGVPPLLARRGD